MEKQQEQEPVRYDVIHVGIFHDDEVFPRLRRYMVFRHVASGSNGLPYYQDMRGFFKEKNAIKMAQGLADGTWTRWGPLMYSSQKTTVLDD